MASSLFTGDSLDIVSRNLWPKKVKISADLASKAVWRITVSDTISVMSARITVTPRTAPRYHQHGNVYTRASIHPEAAGPSYRQTAGRPVGRTVYRISLLCGQVQTRANMCSLRSNVFNIKTRQSWEDQFSNHLSIPEKQAGCIPRSGESLHSCTQAHTQTHWARAKGEREGRRERTWKNREEGSEVERERKKERGRDGGEKLMNKRSWTQ